MVRNHSLARSILEQQWGRFVEMLTYKAESAGGWVVAVDPRGTSQRCSECGAEPDEKIGLEVRLYRCGACGLVMDRDVNAAKNVLRARHGRARGRDFARDAGSRQTSGRVGDRHGVEQHAGYYRM